MDGEELRRWYASGQRDFSGLDLREVNISGIAPDSDILNCDEPDINVFTNLSGINLSRANLSGANLSGANLSGANLSGANLSGANLSAANLTKARLLYCILIDTNLSNANLTRACLDCAEFDNTDLRGADLLLAEICQTSFRADAAGAKNVKTVNFTGTTVSGLVLDDGTVIDSDHDW